MLCNERGRARMMEQHEINQAEWSNPDNWAGSRWASVYFSKRDLRAWVPKQIPAMGWTINFGQPRGHWWMLAILTGMLLMVLGMSVAVVTLGA